MVNRRWLSSYVRKLSDEELAKELEARGAILKVFSDKIEGIYEQKALPYLYRHRAGDTKAAEEFLLLCAGRIV